MSASSLSENLFSERAFDILYTLKNKDEFRTTALLNIDSSKHAFIDKKFAQEICDKLNISLQELIKAKLIRKYSLRSKVCVPRRFYTKIPIFRKFIAALHVEYSLR